MEQRDPHLPRHASPSDLPARLRETWERVRIRLGTSQTMAGVTAVVALVLTIAVVTAVLAAGGGGEDPKPAAHTEPASTTIDATSTPAATAAATPSPSASPSETESEEDQPDPPKTDLPNDAAEETEDEPEYPADGWYQIKQEASGLCLGTGPEPGNEGRTVVVLAGCGSTNPSTIQVVAWDEGVYVLNLHFSDWSACIGTDAPADQEGYLMGPYGCEFTETQFWELQPQGGGVYTIATSASGLCVGILEGRSSSSGEPTATDSCDPGNATQRFTLS